MLSRDEILTLNDNKKYSVVYSIELDLKNYVYLIDQDDYTNTLLCEYDRDSGLTEITDPELVEQLMMKFNAITEQ